MKNFEHFLNEANKELKMTDLEQLTITKDGTTEVHTSTSSKTVEDAQAEEGETDPSEKPKTKVQKEKSNGNAKPDDTPTEYAETKKED